MAICAPTRGGIGTRCCAFGGGYSPARLWLPPVGGRVDVSIDPGVPPTPPSLLDTFLLNLFPIDTESRFSLLIFGVVGV